MVIKIGDIHSRFEWLIEFIAQFPEGTVFIQVGDFGIGLGGPRHRREDIEYLHLINDTLNQNDQYMYVVRGNHDNPAWFDGSYKYSNLFLVPDYHTTHIDGDNYLFLGGAISIDRLANTKGVDYFENEGFDLRWDVLSQFREVDVVIAHSAPNFAHPQLEGPLVYKYALGTKDHVDPVSGRVLKKGLQSDPELLGDLRRERMLFTAAFQELKRNNPRLKAWYYGHFHHSHVEEIEGVKFKLLNIKEAAE